MEPAVQRLALIGEASDLEAKISEPGFALDGRIFVNFAQPAEAEFLVRFGMRDGARPVLEMHQPHPRGVNWATLELPFPKRMPCSRSRRG